MTKRFRNLIDHITSMENLREAYRRTSKGKRGSFGYLEFKEYHEANLSLIQQEIMDGGYRIGEYRQFTIYEPKPRIISALSFKDRVVQHALCNVIGPIFDRSLLPYTFACRTGMGTHAGIRHIQSKLRKTKSQYFLKTDFSKFFPSVDRSILSEQISRKIKCARTMTLVDQMVPPTGVGIPIGSLTSQLFANVYGDPLDRLIHFEMPHSGWARYMDDVVILGNDLNNLRTSFDGLASFSEDRLKLRISKWQASPVTKGINFLGYRIWGSHKLIRKDSVSRAKSKISRFVSTGDAHSLVKFINSWSGHAKWADTHNLFSWMENRHGITV